MNIHPKRVCTLVCRDRKCTITYPTGKERVLQIADDLEAEFNSKDMIDTSVHSEADKQWLVITPGAESPDDTLCRLLQCRSSSEVPPNVPVGSLYRIFIPVAA